MLERKRAVAIPESLVRKSLMGLVLALLVVSLSLLAGRAWSQTGGPTAQTSGWIPPSPTSGGSAHLAGAEGISNLVPVATPIPTEEACRPGTGWTWTYGSSRPDLAAQVQQTLSGLGIDSLVEARAFGETDSCDAFYLHAIDFALTVGGDAPIEGGKRQDLIKIILPVLERHGKPNLGRVSVTFSPDGDTTFINPPTAAEFPAKPRPLASPQGEVHQRNVYVVVFDPLLSNGQTLSEFNEGWSNHADLTQGTIDFFQQVSSNQVQYTVVDTTIVDDGWPVLTDGFAYAEEEYLAVLSGQSPPHQPSTVDYNLLVNSPEFDICGRVNRGEIDEVWMYNAPYFGFWESTLVGPDAYWYNSAPVPGPWDCARLVPIMGPSLERGLDVPPTISDTGSNRRCGKCMGVGSRTARITIGRNSLWWNTCLQTMLTVAVATSTIPPTARAITTMPIPPPFPPIVTIFTTTPTLETPLTPSYRPPVQIGTATIWTTTPTGPATCQSMRAVAPTTLPTIGGSTFSVPSSPWTHPWSACRQARPSHSPWRRAATTPAPLYLRTYWTGWNEIYFGKCTAGQNITSGFRFADVVLPRGAQIIEAHLRFTVDGPYNNDLSVAFFGEATGDAEPFSDYQQAADRPLTSASTTWTVTPSDAWSMAATRNSPDLSAVLQEILDRSDWNSGNALAIIAQNAGPDTGPSDHRRVFAYERLGNGEGAAKLVVTYAEPPVAADFVGDPLAGNIPLTVDFADRSMGSVTEWLWDFGDGATSTLQNPSHVYSETGSFSVTLTVGGDGDQDVKARSDYVVAFSPSPLQGLNGSYYDYAGDPAEPPTDPFGDGVFRFERTDPNVDFDWGSGSPEPSLLGDDQFAVRWEGWVRSPFSGDVTFRVHSDDGSRLQVGDQTSELWIHCDGCDNTLTLAMASGEWYPLELEYFEQGDMAQVQLAWLLPDEGDYVPVPAAFLQVPAAVPGLSGRYYDYEWAPYEPPPAPFDEGVYEFERVDPTVEFDWAEGSPDADRLGDQRFAIRWEGWIRSPVGGVVSFNVHSDDGTILEIGEERSELWVICGDCNNALDLSMLRGVWYPIRLEFFEYTGIAQVQLKWRLPGDTQFVTVPEEHLLGARLGPREAVYGLDSGWNLLGPRLDTEPPTAVEAALEAIENQGGDASNVYYWSSEGDTWQGHTKGLPFNNFALELGSGYFLRAGIPSTWACTGQPPENPVPVELEPVWTLISLPKMPGPMTAGDLLSDANAQGGGCTQVSGWDNTISDWQIHIPDLPASDFALADDEGYFVQCANAITYTPGSSSAQRLPSAWPDPLEPEALEPVSDPLVSDVLVTNRRDVAFTVTWRTDGPSTGWVEYAGRLQNLGQVAHDDLGEGTVSRVHQVTLTNLTPETAYYFRVHSGDSLDDNHGALYQVTTRAPTLPSVPYLAYGQVVVTDGSPELVCQPWARWCAPGD